MNNQQQDAAARAAERIVRAYDKWLFMSVCEKNSRAAVIIREEIAKPDAERQGSAA